VGSDSFEQQIVIDAEAGSRAQHRRVPAAGPGRRHGRARLPDAAGRGIRDWIAENYAAGQSWVDLGTYADRTATTISTASSTRSM
jgi:alpha-glucoside transport system substrate-binding protein